MQFDFGNLESPLSGTVFINGNLEPWRDALHSSHKGGTRPSYAVEGMLWVNDTTNPWVLNMFDGSNDIAIGTFDTTTNVFTPSGVSQAAEDISFDNTDSGLTATNVQDAIDEAVSDFSDFEGRPDGFATSAQGALADTALQTSIITIAPVPTTSGTSVPVTGILPNCKRFTVVLNGVSTNGATNPLIQLVDSGGAETSGYLATGGLTAAVSTFYANGFGWTGAGASNLYTGHISFSKVPGTNTWVCSGVVSNASSTGPATWILGGSKTMSDAVTGIMLTTTTGTDTFDAGSVSIFIEI